MYKHPVINSKALSKIIFHIANGSNYAQKIAQLTGNQPSPIVIQLKKIEKLKLLTSKEEKLLNKKVYSVNYPNLIKEFLNMLQQIEQSDDPETKKTFKQFTSPGFKKRIHNNPILIDMLSSTLAKLTTSNNTIHDVFITYIRKGTLLNDHCLKIKRKLTNEEADFSQFVAYLELIDQHMDIEHELKKAFAQSLRTVFSQKYNLF